MKNSSYKDQIEKCLNQLNWQIVEIGQDDYWWLDEHWKVVYKYDQNIIFYICFIVDPQFYMPRKKGQGICEVKASKEIPTNWNDNDNTIASLWMSKRKFNIKLAEFINEISQLDLALFIVG